MGWILIPQCTGTVRYYLCCLHQELPLCIYLLNTKPYTKLLPHNLKPVTGDTNTSIWVTTAAQGYVASRAGFL